MTLQTTLTEQQTAAIFAKGVSVSLSAGAGSGKTFVLTQRFLTSLEPGSRTEPTDLHSLVAITFTERAAREMRDRIREACHLRLQHCSEEHAHHWQQILRGLDSARISTIHSFCASLLRSRAVEAGLDPGFTVLEPPLSNVLLRQVVRKTLHEQISSANDDATQLVVQFGLERTRELLQSLTTQRFSQVLSDPLQTSAQELADRWIRDWKTQFVPKLIARFRDSPLIQQVLQAIADEPSNHQVMKERISYLISVLSPTAIWQDPRQILEAVAEAARVQGGGGKKDWNSDEQYEKAKFALQKLREKAGALLADLEFNPENVASAAEHSCRAVRLVDQIGREFDAAKRNQSALDFDDLLLQARNLLRDHPEVRRRVAAGIQQLMVDEFQDTDPVQAEVVRSLCGSALTQGKLFMVGDRKQSIYRFRRADPTVFTTMSDQMPAPGRLSLNVNFRSQPAILKFVNFLFASAMPGYERLTPFKDLQLSPTPAIEFLFATAEADQQQRDPQHRPSATELRALEADWIARRIRELLSDPTPRIRTKQRDAQGLPILKPVQRGDIVILFRALSDVQQYEAALRKYGLDYYLVGGRAFFAQQEVFDLLNLCRYLDDPDDLIALVGVLRSPFFNLSDDSLQALSDSSNFQFDNGPLTLHQTVFLEPPSYLPDNQRNRIQFAADVLTRLRASKDRVPLSELLTSAIEQTGYDASLLVEFMGDRKLANLRKLIEMARQFETADFFTLKEFVLRLQTSVLEETDEEFAATHEEASNVIRLMSIHQSKGLEFPVVIVADIDRQVVVRGYDAVMNPQLGPLIKQPDRFGSTADHLALRMHRIAEEEADAAETVRLFYVACTRAADHLILSAGRDSSKPPRSPWMQLLDSRFDLLTGLAKLDPLLGSSSHGTAGRESVPEIRKPTAPAKFSETSSTAETKVSNQQLPATVLAALPGELPDSAARFEFDRSDISIISVSRLESIDEELSHDRHARRTFHPTERQEDDVDSDLATSLGDLVHAVLEQVDFGNPSRWTDLLLRTADQMKDSKREEIIQQARTLLTRFFASPIPGELSAAKSLHQEIDFLLAWGSGDKKSRSPDSPCEPLISGVIDVLAETATGWQILDYKTGEFPIGTPVEQLIAPYELQLSLYSHAVTQGFGVVPTELSLIVFRPEVRRITLPWSPSRWEVTRARVDRALKSVRGF